MGAAERISNTGPLETHDEPDDGSVGSCDHFCVDDAGSIACLSTRQVWMALAQGRIGPETRVWRDGLGHWSPIAEVPELTQDDEEGPSSIPEQSEIRLRERPSQASNALRPPPHAQRVLATLAQLRDSWLALCKRAWHFGAHRAGSALAVVLGVTVGALVGVAGFAAVAAWQRAHEPVPRAQRVAIDVAERARYFCSRARAQSLEQERAWWAQRWR